jgi:hypothetical protein
MSQSVPVASLATSRGAGPFRRRGCRIEGGRTGAALVLGDPLWQPDSPEEA